MLYKISGLPGTCNLQNCSNFLFGPFIFFSWLFLRTPDVTGIGLADRSNFVKLREVASQMGFRGYFPVCGQRPRSSRLKSCERSSGKKLPPPSNSHLPQVL